MLFSFTEVSGNSKTGPITVTKSSSDTCPPSCGMWFDCYAKMHHLAGHWKRLDRGEGNAFNLSDFVANIRSKADGLWRYGEAGDLPGRGNKIDSKALDLIVRASRGKRGFAYTHKPVFAGNYRIKGPKGQVKKGKISEQLAANNRKAIESANKQGFVINLSADNLKDADRKVALGIAPVVTVLPLSIGNISSLKTPAGNKVVVCPAQRIKDITCKKCKLCAIPKRKSIIGFIAHGGAKKRISNRLKVIDNF